MPDYETTGDGFQIGHLEMNPARLPTVFDYTGGSFATGSYQTFQVPADRDLVRVYMRGASGYGARATDLAAGLYGWGHPLHPYTSTVNWGSLPANVTGFPDNYRGCTMEIEFLLSVIPGSRITVQVPGQGGLGGGGYARGWPDGAPGASDGYGPSAGAGGGSCAIYYEGASWPDWLAVIGGAGGASGRSGGGLPLIGGGGVGLFYSEYGNATYGTNKTYMPAEVVWGGGAGTLLAPGQGGTQDTVASTIQGNPGSTHFGGSALSSPGFFVTVGGSGGGGFYGGGGGGSPVLQGGGSYAGDGGGGSTWLSPACSIISWRDAFWVGNGQVKFWL